MKSNFKSFSISTIENVLKSLPKKCSCSSCESFKKLVLGEVGQSTYKKYLKEYNIAH